MTARAVSDYKHIQNIFRLLRKTIIFNLIRLECQRSLAEATDR
jgi:hypothetical protein